MPLLKVTYSNICSIIKLIFLEGTEIIDCTNRQKTLAVTPKGSIVFSVFRDVIVFVHPFSSHVKVI